jgi:hypothetical protein
MKFHSLCALAAAAVSLCAGTVQAATTNGFANGGFETVGATTPADSWLGAASGYSLSTDAHTGIYSALLASPQIAAAIIVQNSVKDGGLPALTVGDVPTLSFWAKGSAGGTGNVSFILQYLDSTGNILADSKSVAFQNQINTTSWSQITYTLPTGVPTGASAAYLQLVQAIGPIDATNLAGAVRVDDVYLGVTAPVPEPSSVALMLAGLGAIGAIVRRRTV